MIDTTEFVKDTEYKKNIHGILGMTSALRGEYPVYGSAALLAPDIFLTASRNVLSASGEEPNQLYFERRYYTGEALWTEVIEVDPQKILRISGTGKIFSGGTWDLVAVKLPRPVTRPPEVFPKPAPSSSSGNIRTTYYQSQRVQYFHSRSLASKAAPVKSINGHIAMLRAPLSWKAGCVGGPWILAHKGDSGFHLTGVTCVIGDSPHLPRHEQHYASSPVITAYMVDAIQNFISGP